MTPASSPRAVIAAPLYNGAAHLASALDSLLAQSEPSFALLLVDDGSQDETPSIARRYAQQDSRISYWRNPDRLGVVGNWRRCLALARELHPQAELFAWASDHDLWDPRWLEALIAQFDRHPGVVLAYPRTERMTAEGAVTRVRGAVSTVGVADAAERIRIACRGVHAGDGCYGLMRVEAVERVACFRPLLEPDRLMMAELAALGQFAYADEVTWQRRFVKSASRARQRRQLFTGRPPLHTRLPPWLVRPVVFWWLYGVRGNGRPQIPCREGRRLALAYLQASSALLLDHRRALARRRFRSILKRGRRVRRRVRAAVGGVRIRAGAAWWPMAGRLGLGPTHRRPATEASEGHGHADSAGENNPGLDC